MRPFILAVASAAFLCGCAHDDYAVVSGGAGTQEHLRADLSECKHQAIQAYFDSRNNPAHGAALLFGATGGLLAGAAAGEQQSASKEIPASEINPMIETCMVSRGYIGTSEN